MTLVPGNAEPITLASGSKARASVLRAAGISFEQVPVSVDEEEIRDALRAEGASPAIQAEVLAETKAVRGSPGRRGIVLGADQMLDLDGKGFDKPRDLQDAKNHLRALRGRTHVLQTAMVACIEGSPVWRHIARPKLVMRNVSDAFIDAYIEELGEKALTSVGAYHVEGIGAQLFERIEGDQYSILGVPLLPLMQWLRDRGALMS